MPREGPIACSEPGEPLALDDEQDYRSLMADLQAALGALQTLQRDDVAVAIQGDTASVTVHYRDESIGPDAEKASYTFHVAFDQAAGQYKITHEQTSTTAGPGGLGVEKKFGSGKNISMSKSISFGGGESSSSSFNSKAWEDEISQCAEAAGWTRKKGFLGKLFGK